MTGERWARLLLVTVALAGCSSARTPAEADPPAGGRTAGGGEAGDSIARSCA